MKNIGLIGGMSWESSAIYYRLINKTVKRRLGASHSAKCIMISVDFDEVEKMQSSGQWKELGDWLTDIAVTLERAGADIIIICSNTMHKVYDDVQKSVKTPIIHIAEPTAESIKARGLNRIGLLGTSYTMQQDFYKGRLRDWYGLEVIIPDEDEMAIVDEVIFQELVRGHVKSSSRERYITIINNMKAKGAEGVILGCTEIGMLIGEKDVDIPIFDTTVLHAVAAVNFVL